MALLICKFASPQSRPEKIERWIAYLEQIQQRTEAKPDERALVQGLHAEAQKWLVRP